MLDLSFYKGKRVFLTGHTGFKGAWLSRILVSAGAKLTGYALLPPTQPDLFTLSSVSDKMTSTIGDVRDFSSLRDVFERAEPEIVFHLAAQPIVRTSYEDPVGTYETNVMGTVHLLECARHSETVRSFLNVTTDKVYENREWEWGYREDEPLDGYDPYSNSKSCSELVTHSYVKSFFQDRNIAVSTARAGNVIGGGDFARDRIIPDCIRALNQKENIIVRNPYSTRPYQHVLEPLYVYLLIAAKQYEDKQLAGYYNVGPDDRDCLETGHLVDLFCKAAGGRIAWENKYDGGPHEAGFLKLDCSRVKKIFGWTPRWDVRTAVEKTVEWSDIFFADGDIPTVMDKQISEFFST